MIPYLAVYFGIATPPALAVAHCLGQFLGKTDSWWKDGLATLLAMSLICAAFTLAMSVMLCLDRKIGIKCAACGGRLSTGRGSGALHGEGGDCPHCGEPAVERVVKMRRVEA